MPSLKRSASSATRPPERVTGFANKNRAASKGTPLFPGTGDSERSPAGRSGAGTWCVSRNRAAHAGTRRYPPCNDLARPTHTTGWLRFAGSRLAEERGTCLVELHQYAQAETSLTQALQLGPSDRRTGSINTDLAMIGARLHDIDRVTTYAGQALIAAQHTKSGYVMKKLTGLQPHLVPLLANRAVRQLGDQITHLSTTLATA